MDLTFRTLGAWGEGKGSNLEAGEVDSNFWSLAQAIFDLQNNPAEPNGIASITVAGTQMTITLTDGTVMGPFTLPVLTFRWRGEWAPATLYAVLDVFTVLDTGIFMVQVAHTSADTFDQAGLIAAGTILQLFGSTDAKLSGLSDVLITDLIDGNFLTWVYADQMWENVALGSMAYEDFNSVVIMGGVITGMPTPVNPSDVATKAYVDALPAGMTIADAMMMANISGFVGPALPNTLSDFLDHVLGTTTRGTLLFRGGPGWIALPPGTAGLFLQTAGPGADPTWHVGASGVTSIAAGTGIDTGGAPIIGSGTVALAAVVDSRLLANVSGASAAPTPQTLSAILDHILTNARGTILARQISGWGALAPGTSGYYLKTQGAGADVMWDAPVGSGTVTSISAGTGISTGGSPIVGTGTVSLDTIASDRILANISGSTAAPIANTLTAIFDHIFGSTQGAVLYRSATAWVMLTPGTSGQILTTGGTAANPSWQNAPTTGGSVGNGQIISNISGSSAVPVGNTLTNILDSIIGSSRGTLLYRTNSGWVGLAPGTSGQVLTTAGSSGDPNWATNFGASLAISSPAARDILSYNSSSGKFENVRPKYVIGDFVPGVMSASQNLLFHKFPIAVTLPANLGAYLGHATVAGGSTAATASTAITLARALSASPTTFATVATITISAASVTGSMSTQAAISFAQGDILRVRGPATPDVTLADFHLSLAGFES